MSEWVSFSSRDGIGQVVFDRAPANAYDLSFHEQFIDAIDAAGEDETTRVVVVRSALEKFFCAGADVNAFAANSTADNRMMVDAARRALAGIEASAKVFVALIEGHALGGGLEIAVACDIRFGAQGDYGLGLPEARLGLIPGNGGSQRLPRLVGASQAIALLTSGESIGPDEALRIGLIDRTFPADQALERTLAFAGAIAASAPLAVSACKRAVREGLQLSLQDGLALEARLVDELYETADAKEGFEAAVRKRAPEYKGR